MPAQERAHQVPEVLHRPRRPDDQHVESTVVGTDVGNAGDQALRLEAGVDHRYVEDSEPPRASIDRDRAWDRTEPEAACDARPYVGQEPEPTLLGAAQIPNGRRADTDAGADEAEASVDLHPVDPPHNRLSRQKPDRLVQIPRDTELHREHVGRSHRSYEHGDAGLSRGSRDAGDCAVAPRGDHDVPARAELVTRHLRRILALLETTHSPLDGSGVPAESGLERSGLGSSGARIRDDKCPPDHVAQRPPRGRLLSQTGTREPLETSAGILMLAGRRDACQDGHPLPTMKPPAEMPAASSVLFHRPESASRAGAVPWGQVRTSPNVNATRLSNATLPGEPQGASWITRSTRRLRCRPSSVLLSSAGRLSPYYPSQLMRFGSTSCEARNS